MKYGMIASIISFLIGLGLALPFYHDEKEEDKISVVKKDGNKILEKEILTSPLIGEVMALEEVPDEAFSSGVVGKGVAILPSEGKVIAPADSTVMTIFPTGHALGLITDKGTEILIHIGIDTVKLNGQYFQAKVKQGDTVKRGQVLVEFDLEKIKAAGYSVITPVLITNFQQYLDIIGTEKGNIDYKESLITVIA
jgi:PTS system beta-glucosides-specific IIC component